MNIAVQMCGLINTIVLLLFYCSSKRLRLYKGKIFLAVLLITFVNIALDINSVIVIYHRAEIPDILVEFACKLYLCAVVAESLSALAYVLADVLIPRKHKKLSLWLVAVGLIACSIIFSLPIHIYTNRNYVYTYGGSVMTLYIVSAINLSLTWVFTFVFANKMNPRRKFAVRLWMLIWIVAMGIQAMNNELLVVGFAASLGMVVLYFCLENPEGQNDDQFDCFNQLAFIDYIEQCKANEETFALFDISVANVSVMSEKGGLDKKILKSILQLFNKYSGVYVFKNIDKNIIVVSKNLSMLDTAIRDFLSEFEWLNANGRELEIQRLESIEELQSAEDVLRFLAYVRAKNHDSKRSIVYITYGDIKEFYRREEIQSEVATALLEDRVEIYLQPIYNAIEKKITSAEALVRIRNNDGTMLYPNEFIPVAEETGQIHEIGRRVFDKTCEFLATTNALDLGIKFVEVNLSVVQAEQVDLCLELINTVEKYGVSPKHLDLELTESAFLKSKGMVIDNMVLLKERGFTFALDDFGKGESNLMYLVDMPFDIVKLDMDMTKAFKTNEKAKSIVGAVSYMVNEMKLKIVAEGIETKDELDSFLKYNIDYIQGFYFAKPLPIKEFLRYVTYFNQQEVTN